MRPTAFSPRRTLAITRKEFLQILRDWRSLVIVAVMPVALTLLFGYGVSLDIKHVPLCVYDREGSRKSQDLLKHFQASEYFAITSVVRDYRQLTHEVQSGACGGAIVIPHDFSKRLNEGGPVGIQAIVDASDNNTANIAIGYTDAILTGYSASLQANWIQARGYPRIRAPLTIDARTWFNEDLESRAFILPGVIAIVMSVIGTFLTSLTIAREWEHGTMEQLVSTPVTPFEVITGKLVPYFVIGMIATAMCTAVGVYWFQIPFRGSLLTLFAGRALFLASVLGLGCGISAFARAQLVACQISIVATYMPSFILSGFIFAIDQMPAPIRAITYLVAARYYDSVLKGVFLKGIGLWELRDELLAMAALAAAAGAFAISRFRKRID